MKTLKTDLKIIGVNPYIQLAGKLLEELFRQAGKDRGPIPVQGTINGIPYRQTLVRYAGAWRLYVNGKMLRGSPKRIGEIVTYTVWFDSSDRTIKPHPKFLKALGQNPDAKLCFEGLRPSRRKEIIRYISSLKTQASVDRNIVKALDHLMGKGGFAGRDKP